MKFLKQFGVLALAFAAAGAASAATITQPFTAVSAKVTLDTSVLSSNKLTAGSAGDATYNATTGVVTDPLVTVSLSTDPGALNLAFSSTGGISFYSAGLFGLPINVATIKNFSFDLATNTLTGDLITPAGNAANQALLVAGNVQSNFGGVDGRNVSSSTSVRSIGLIASSFTLAPSFRTLLGSNASSFEFVGSAIKSFTVGTVPEPSTYAMLGLGLVGIAAVARRKQQA